MKCYVLRGLPGSGKSSKARQIVEDYSSQGLRPPIVCSADNFRYENGLYVFKNSREPHDKCLELFKNSVDSGHDVIVDNINAELRSMKPYVEYAHQAGYEIIIISIQPIDIETLMARGLHNVPRESYERFLRRWVPRPTVQEILENGKSTLDS
jgi:predicted kinase